MSSSPLASQLELDRPRPSLSRSCRQARAHNKAPCSGSLNRLARCPGGLYCEVLLEECLPPARCCSGRTSLLSQHHIQVPSAHSWQATTIHQKSCAANQDTRTRHQQTPSLIVECWAPGIPSDVCVCGEQDLMGALILMCYPLLNRVVESMIGPQLQIGKCGAGHRAHLRLYQRSHAHAVCCIRLTPRVFT